MPSARRSTTQRRERAADQASHARGRGVEHQQVPQPPPARSLPESKTREVLRHLGFLTPVADHPRIGEDARDVPVAGFREAAQRGYWYTGALALQAAVDANPFRKSGGRSEAGRSPAMQSHLATWPATIQRSARAHVHRCRSLAVFGNCVQPTRSLPSAVLAPPASERSQRAVFDEVGTGAASA